MLKHHAIPELQEHFLDRIEAEVFVLVVSFCIYHLPMLLLGPHSFTLLADALVVVLVSTLVDDRVELVLVFWIIAAPFFVDSTPKNCLG